MSNCDASNGTIQDTRKPNVAIMTHPYFERAGETPLNNLTKLINSLANRLFIITGGDYNDPPSDDVEIIRVKAKRRISFFARFLEQFLVHVRIFRLLFQLRRKVDILIFFLGTPFPAPLILAQALGLKCFVTLTGVGSAPELSAIRGSRQPRKVRNSIILHVTQALERLSYHSADKLIVYSPSIIDAVKLHKYRNKIVVANHHMTNFDLFIFKSDIERRNNVVGYIGRLSHEKGILNLVEAIPQIRGALSNVTFLIIGEGPLEHEIRNRVERNALPDEVKLTGWVPHKDLPDYVASMKLLVLPSFAEGLPSVMLEAMACGTPVLASSVGSIPDFIVNGETGLLLHDNSPSCLAETIIAALENPNLKRTAIKAQDLVKSQFQFERSLETWGKIICCPQGK